MFPDLEESDLAQLNNLADEPDDQSESADAAEGSASLLVDRPESETQESPPLAAAYQAIRSVDRPLEQLLHLSLSITSGMSLDSLVMAREIALRGHIPKEGGA